MTIFQDYRLSHWEEISGLLNKVDAELNHATIGKYNVFLPKDVLTELKTHLGKRISLLKTDLLHKPYIFRILQEQTVVESGGD